ncbi:hypothetical protein IGI04_011510, partial [Brassica rapa subsp. trilocularis]
RESEGYNIKREEVKEIKEKDTSIPIVGEKGHHHHLRNLISASSAPSVIPNPTLDFSSFFFYPPISTLSSPTAPSSSLEFLLINPDFDPRNC